MADEVDRSRAARVASAANESHDASSALPNRPNAKLPRPKGMRVQKRPIGRRPTSSNTRTIYVSTKTPFMAVITRTLKILRKTPQRTKGMLFTERIQAASDVAGGKEDKEAKDDVLIVGTGRAIEKVVEIAAWLQRKGDLRVSLRTSSVGAVDDLVPVERGDGDDGAGDNYENEEENKDEAVISTGREELAHDAVAEPSARVRWMSCLEVGVRMK